MLRDEQARSVIDPTAHSQVSSTQMGQLINISCGLLLIAAMLAIALLSPGLSLDAPTDPYRVIGYVGIMFAAGLVQLLWLACLRHSPGSMRTLLWIGFVGLMMRAIIWPSTPILENDFYRYLWDGAVTAAGHSPYTVAPSDLVHSDLAPLAADAQAIVDRINHPHLRTIYPPVAQGMFALAHQIAPLDYLGLRALWLVLDGLVGLILLLALRRLGQPQSWVMIWWACPLLVAQVGNDLHMDVLVAMLVTASILAAISQRHFLGAILLALAVGTKLWPALLLPLLMRQAGLRRGAMACAIFCAIVAMLAWPVLDAGLDEQSGFTAYSENWINNEGLFRLQYNFWQWLCPMLPIEGCDAGRITRLITAWLMGLFALGAAVRPISDGRDLAHRALLIACVLFILSPTQFPWYFVWVLGLLALSPRWSLLIYPTLLCGYHLQWLWSGVVWLEHGPVWLMLLIETWRGRGRWTH